MQLPHRYPEEAETFLDGSDTLCSLNGQHASRDQDCCFSGCPIPCVRMVVIDSKLRVRYIPARVDEMRLVGKLKVPLALVV